MDEPLLLAGRLILVAGLDLLLCGRLPLAVAGRLLLLGGRLTTVSVAGSEGSPEFYEL